MKFFFALVVLCLSGAALGQVPGWGPCPDIESMPDFDSVRFEGKWYEAQRYFAAFEFTAQCVTAEFSPGEDDTIFLSGSAIAGISGNMMFRRSWMSLEVPNTAEPGTFKISGSSAPMKGKLMVLGTDYETYAVVYSCTNMEMAHFSYAWLLSRDQHPTQEAIDEAYAVMKKYRIHRRWLMKTEQEDCEVETSEETSEQVEE